MKAATIAALAAMAFVAVIAFASPARPEPIEPSAIRINDGDTIEAAGAVYRLVGYDTPETGQRARCPLERDLGAKAAARLKELIAGGGLDLDPVACSCRPGAEGTPACNRGRRCAVLRIGGRDVGAILIGEGLAHPLRCGARSCPPLRPWC